AGASGELLGRTATIREHGRSIRGAFHESVDRGRLLLTAAASLLAVPAAAEGRRGRSAEPTEDEQPSADSLIPPGAAEGTLILDVHAHLLGSTRGDYIGAAQAAVRFMDQLGIEKTIVMPVPQPQNFRHSYDV